MPGAPSAWVVEQAAALPPGSLVLDLAAGRGRHALALARLTHRVVAVDIAEAAMRSLLATRARVAGGAVCAVVADLGALPLRAGVADAVLVVNYLDRGLFPVLRALPRPGGRLIVETYTMEQRALARGPRDPAHLLRAGELAELVAPLAIVARREGLVRDEAGERYVAGVVAERR